MPDSLRFCWGFFLTVLNFRKNSSLACNDLGIISVKSKDAFYWYFVLRLQQAIIYIISFDSQNDCEMERKVILCSPFYR